MKTRYKHIYFEKIELPIIDAIGYWNVKSIRTDAILGQITFFEDWKRYVFSAVGNLCIFDVGCLQDIIHFINQL